MVNSKFGLGYTAMLYLFIPQTCLSESCGLMISIMWPLFFYLGCGSCGVFFVFRMFCDFLYDLICSRFFTNDDK
jgi:hypothetical protein